jgi:hypothetical protein
MEGGFHGGKGMVPLGLSPMPIEGSQMCHAGVEEERVDILTLSPVSQFGAGTSDRWMDFDRYSHHSYVPHSPVSHVSCLSRTHSLAHLPAFGAMQSLEPPLSYVNPAKVMDVSWTDSDDDVSSPTFDGLCSDADSHTDKILSTLPDLDSYPQVAHPQLLPGIGQEQHFLEQQYQLHNTSYFKQLHDLDSSTFTQATFSPSKIHRVIRDVNVMMPTFKKDHFGCDLEEACPRKKRPRTNHSLSSIPSDSHSCPLLQLNQPHANTNRILSSSQTQLHPKSKRCSQHRKLKKRKKYNSQADLHEEQSTPSSPLKHANNLTASISSDFQSAQNATLSITDTKANVPQNDSPTAVVALLPEYQPSSQDLVPNPLTYLLFEEDSAQEPIAISSLVKRLQEMLHLRRQKGHLHATPSSINNPINSFCT